uniref:TIL domain-containing protein n=1 Tax=Steinernema glaseri TaxID=37863 RepID=A0A1I7Y0Q1_9BILA
MRCLLLLLLLPRLFLGHQRVCEVQGNCRSCDNDRYSYYKCANRQDCLGNEFCVEGFCCPVVNGERRHSPVSLCRFASVFPIPLVSLVPIKP